ncbi:MAG TPA: rhomboid family intramembrane serine protease [Polyangia bacterium]|nr:rhomboid family intramembrane serine protease [Polyangia bacterium]
MDHVLRTTASATQAGDWDLVLTAASIGHRVDERDGRFALLVDANDVAAATEALAGFDEEGAPEQQPPAPDQGWSPLGILCAIGFFAMLLVTGPRDRESIWFVAGSASADLIVRGAWWRAVTALTLHADLLHVVGNAVASLVFISAVGRWLGGGLAALLILLSATAANLLTAFRHRTNFESVGASTATFAALGLVAGLQVARRLRLRTRPGYFWVPIGAGLGLFAMLGVAVGSDYWAHLFGLGFGVLFGVAWAFAQLKRGWRAPGPIVQALLGAVALAFVAGCWLLAFHHPG